MTKEHRNFLAHILPYEISALAMTGSGVALIWAFEPGIAPTAYGLGCFLVSYAGALALGVGASVLLLGGMERAGNRLFGL